MTLPTKGPTVLPLLGLEKGRVVSWGKDSWVYARDESGEFLDPFEVSDHLAEKYKRVYLLDVDGMKSNRPQLDYLQELSHLREIWAEAGPQTAEQVIDILVAGATRAVLSLDLFDDPESEIRHTLAMSSEIAVLINLEGEAVKSPDPSLSERPLAEVCQKLTEWGVPVLILPGTAMGWETIRQIASLTAVYVKGVRPEEAESLRASQAAGAIMEVSYVE